MNMQMLMQALQNPQQALQKVIPQEHMNSPQDAVQYLLNSGRVTQQQIQQANNMYQNLFGGRK